MVTFIIIREFNDQPVYEIPPPKYHAERILKILLDPTIPPSKICSVRPTNISRSATYIVDVSKLKHPDDIKNVLGNILDLTHRLTKHKLKRMVMFELRNVLMVPGETLLCISVGCIVYTLLTIHSND